MNFSKADSSSEIVPIHPDTRSIITFTTTDMIYIEALLYILSLTSIIPIVYLTK